MLPISDATFVVVDVETTGSDPISDKITDIACVVVKNNEIISTYSSLMNPHKSIPIFIQKMTGITNSMVKTAPEAIDIMPKIRNLLMQNNTFFVAHNYGFDWRFVHETINRENLLNVDIDKICTLKLARKIIPKSTKKNVGALAEYFNIPILNRHRAFDDAFATAFIFIELLNILQNNYDIFYTEEILEFQDKKIIRPAKTYIRTYHKVHKYAAILPNAPGVIKFIDKNNEVLFISKANHDMQQHMTTFAEQVELSSKKISSIIKEFTHIQWIQAINELETSIVFNREMKKIVKNDELFPKISEANIEFMNKFSLLLFCEDSKREKTINIFFIKKSYIGKILTIGMNSKLNALCETINEIYFNEANIEINDNSVQDIDEIIIVNNWIKKFQNNAIVLHIDDKNATEIYDEAEIIIKNFYKKEQINNDNSYFLEAFTS